jgi:hypothetical protein
MEEPIKMISYSYLCISRIELIHTKAYSPELRENRNVHIRTIKDKWLKWY